MPFFLSSSETSSRSSLIPLSLTLIQPPQHCHKPLSRPSTTITQAPFPLASHCEIQPPIIYKIRQPLSLDFHAGQRYPHQQCRYLSSTQQPMSTVSPSPPTDSSNHQTSSLPMPLSRTIHQPINTSLSITTESAQSC
uniref:Uncharacterized protein n=1 Tax=Populus davidiana TaxID=266767 RepID=A0A6M2FDT9_9ROSI